MQRKLSTDLWTTSLTAVGKVRRLIQRLKPAWFALLRNIQMKKDPIKNSTPKMSTASHTAFICGPRDTKFN